jgi:hypothetical protein
VRALSTGNSAGKASLLLSLLPSRPLEFYDRMLTFLHVRLERLWIQSAPYETKEWHEVLLGMEQTLCQNVSGFTDEPASSEIMEEVRFRIENELSQAPFPLIHNADFTLARLCYFGCRVIKPTIVVETGVAYGVTSAFILKALEVNGRGLLHSVDLPPLGHDADQFVGILIPPSLKHRWRLYRGTSQRVLPRLLSELGRVDLFVHDSLHTYKNMTWEFQAVAPHLGRPAMLVADDVENNSAFLEWVHRTRPAFSATLREVEKRNLFGLTVFP